VSVIFKWKNEFRVSDAILGVAAINRVPCESRRITEVFVSFLAIVALSTCVSQPGNTHTLSLQ
jgi:hypothetical protein